MNATNLIAQLKDADESIRICAALNLGLRRVQAALPALLELLQSDEVIDRRAAARALGRLGAPQAIAALRNALKKDRDAGVQTFAAEALQQISPARRAG